MLATLHATVDGAVATCEPTRQPDSNLVELLPSLPDADLNRYDGRCSRRYASLETAWKACMAEPRCTGVVRDNGLACRKGSAARSHQFELRGGAVRSGAGTAWTCASRLTSAAALNSAPLISSSAPSGTAKAKEGFMFVVLGSCSRPQYDCTFLQEVRAAIAALRRSMSASRVPRPIAVVSDGGIAASTLLEQLRPDTVHIIPPRAFDEAGKKIANEADLRVRKLVAYRHAPFERTVFLDGDTHVRSDDFSMLFGALERGFDLAAAFECCRKDWHTSGKPYDASGFMRGWELQTGVMALRAKSPRVDAFWREATREYSQNLAYWQQRSSGEQGAATLALSRVDIRYVPLPPSFNARPFTMLTYLTVFGLPVYHGKDVWRGRLTTGERAEPDGIIAERMLRDWDATRDILAAQFARHHLISNSSRRSAERGLRKLMRGQPISARQAEEIRRRANAAAGLHRAKATAHPPIGRSEKRGRGERKQILHV